VHGEFHGQRGRFARLDGRLPDDRFRRSASLDGLDPRHPGKSEGTATIIGQVEGDSGRRLKRKIAEIHQLSIHHKTG
jgi:hypothetical protein